MSHISDCVDALSTNDYPLITTGWPDDEYGIHHEAYREWVENIASNLDDETDMPPVMSYQEWKVKQRERTEDRIAEFSRSTCDCCGTTLGGSRYAVTGLPSNPSTDSSYIPYEVCEDCYYMIATGSELE